MTSRPALAQAGRDVFFPETSYCQNLSQYCFIGRVTLLQLARPGNATGLRLETASGQSDNDGPLFVSLQRDLGALSSLARGRLCLRV